MKNNELLTRSLTGLPENVTVNDFICRDRNPESWAAMIMNDEISANAIVKRVTKHYTIMINTK